MNTTVPELTVMSEAISGTNNDVRLKRLASKFFTATYQHITSRRTALTKIEELMTSLMEFSMGHIYMNHHGIVDWSAFNKDVLQAIADVGNENVVAEEQFSDQVIHQLRFLV